jgi:hexokinase
VLGAIFGTGTNGAYVEEVANIKKLAGTHPEVVKTGGHMIVNTEWGAFNNSVCDLLLNGEDIELNSGITYRGAASLHRHMTTR